MQLADGLSSRLEMCVNRMGGKRALALASGVSESQLYRYMADASSIPAERLLAIAVAAKVDAGWLLTGDGPVAPSIDTENHRPAFRPALLTRLIQVFEELLLEFDKPFPPRLRARAIAFMYEALRHREIITEVETTPEKFEIFKYASFLSEMRNEEELETLIKALDLLEYSTSTIDYESNFQLLTSFCNLMARGYRRYYDSYAGQAYFERMGQQLGANNIQYLHNLVEDMTRLCGKSELDWLDIGCGNGRHISHLYRHYPFLRVKGLDLSPFAVGSCHDLIKSAKLPDGSVNLGDFRQLPYPSASFDVVFSRFTLHAMPYLPGTGLGMEAAFEEISRILRKNGVAHILLLYGRGREYLLFRQWVDEKIIADLSKRAGLEIVGCEVEEEVTGLKACPLALGQPTNRKFQIILQKPR